jgi:hypothetical protein
MRRAYVITEGIFDAEMLKKLLPEDVVHNTEFVVASGRYSAQSLARTLLADRQTPVALVLDADTTDEKKIQEQKDFLEELLRQASSGTKFEVFLVKPEMEILLVEDASVIEHLTHKHYSQSELTLARLRPKSFLTEVLEKQEKPPSNHLRLVDNLDEQMVKVIRKHPLITDLNKFLSLAAA